MRSRYVHLELCPADLDVMRALSASDVRWMDLPRLTLAAGYDPNHSADTTRVLASVSHLRRRGIVAWCRPQLRDRPVFALTELGAAELAARDQLRLVA